MICTLSIIRYPKYMGWAGFISMALFHLPLWLNPKISFYKLMGCGKNSSFSKAPDWRQWAVLVVIPEKKWKNDSQLNIKKNNTVITKTNSFINWYTQLFGCEVFSVVLQPIEGHGTWDGKQPFGIVEKKSDYDGLIAVITRATIKITRLQHFWSHVASVAVQMHTASGYITSVGIGEIPLLKQATFSIWENKTALKNFAYKMQQHTQVIKKTHAQKWYSEDMYVRFIPIAAEGTLNGINPLAGKL